MVFHPDTSASSLLFSDLLVRAAGDGVRVTVLSGFPSSELGGPELPGCDRIGELEVRRCGFRRQSKRSLTRRLAGYVGFAVEVGVRLLRLDRTVTVVGGTDPPFLPLLLWFVSRLRGFRYQCILLDVYPDGLTGVGALPSGSPIATIWRGLNRLSFASADRLIVIGRDMVALLRTHYRMSSNRITYIPHWAPAELDSPLESAEDMRGRLGLTDKFIVQYSGNMGMWHDLETLVRAAAIVRDDSRIHFLFIGDGRRRAEAQVLSTRLRLSNVTWHDFVPREQLRASLATGDIALVSLRAGLVGVAVPSKLYGIMAAGKPVLAQVPLASEVAVTVGEARCGVVVAPGDAAALASAILSLADDRESVIAMGKRAREAYSSTYSLARAVSAFRELWTRVPN